MAESFQWPNYGIHSITIPAASISQAAMITTPGVNYQKNYPVQIDFGAEHNIMAGAGYRITGTGVTGIDSVLFYLWPISKNIVELYSDANLTQPYYFRAIPFFGEGTAGTAWAGNNTAGTAAIPADATLGGTVPATLNIGPIVNSSITTGTSSSPVYRRTLGGLKL